MLTIADNETQMNYHIYKHFGFFLQKEMINPSVLHYCYRIWRRVKSDINIFTNKCNKFSISDGEVLETLGTDCGRAN